MTPSERARLSLEGLCLGDAFGDLSFAHPESFADWRERRATPSLSPWPWSDDTAMALSVVEVLQAHGEADEDALAAAFLRSYEHEPHRGYGGGAHRLFQEMLAGRSWSDAAAALFGGEGSHGNGAAMRVAPLGAWFADDPQRAAGEARRSARVTHAHPEGKEGAVAVAVAAAHAWRHGASGAPVLIDAALEHVREGEVASRLRTVRELPATYSPRGVASVVGSGREISAADTVPYALWCAARHLDDFEAAMWATAEGGGDVDTTCAIVGGIVALSVGREGLPREWLSRREPLP